MDDHDRRAALLDEALTSPPEVPAATGVERPIRIGYSGGVAIGLAFTGAFPMPSLASSRLRRIMDASQDQTDGRSFAPLEATADVSHNYLRGMQRRSPEELLVDRAQLQTLTAPEMTVPVGGCVSLVQMSRS